jgi:valyl-tRNA synthetase
MQEEIARLEGELKRLEGELKRVDGKLSNEKFVANAPADVVEKEKEKQIGYQSQFNEVRERLDNLKRKG